MESKYGTELPIFGVYQGGLNNSGERIRLADNRGAEICDFIYMDCIDWPCAADGTGHSIVVNESPTFTKGFSSLSYSGNWRFSTDSDGSPGKPDPPKQKGLRINELKFDQCGEEFIGSDEWLLGWVELYNESGSPIDLKGYYLSDDPGYPLKWELPEKTFMPGTYFVHEMKHLVRMHISANGNGTSSPHVNLLLSCLLENQRHRVVDCLSTSFIEQKSSCGRFPETRKYLVPMEPSRGDSNQPGEIRLVISEIMYRGEGWIGKKPLPEFIELYNPDPYPILVDNETSIRQIRGDIEFTIPENTVIPGNGVLVLVCFDVHDPEARSAFESVYGLSQGTLNIIGPYTGNLSNYGGRITIGHSLSGCTHEAASLPTLSDEVTYFHLPPWPLLNSASPQSIHRKTEDLSGEDPYNWFSDPPSPGKLTIKTDTSIIRLN